MSYMRVLRAAEEPVAEIEPVLYEKNHPGPRLRAQITVLQAHPADFDQSFTPSLRSMTRGEDRHPISVVIAGVCPLSGPEMCALLLFASLPSFLGFRSSKLRVGSSCQWPRATGTWSRSQVHPVARGGTIAPRERVIFFRALYFIVLTRMRLTTK